MFIAINDLTIFFNSNCILDYPDGWFFVGDIIHHIPLDLMLKIVNLNKAKVNLEKLVPYATHPVFKYLPLMCLSSDVQSMLSQGLKK